MVKAALILLVIVVLVAAVFVFITLKRKKLREERGKLFSEMEAAGFKVNLSGENIGFKPLAISNFTHKVEWWTEAGTSPTVVIYQPSVSEPFVFTWKSSFDQKGALILHPRAQNSLAEGFLKGKYGGFSEINPEELEKPLTGRLSAFAKPKEMADLLVRSNLGPAYINLKTDELLLYDAGNVYFQVKIKDVPNVEAINQYVDQIKNIEKSLTEPIKALDGGYIITVPDEVSLVTFINIDAGREYFGKLLVDADNITFIGAWDKSMVADAALSGIKSVAGGAGGSPSLASHVSWLECGRLVPEKAPHKFCFPHEEISEVKLGKGVLGKLSGQSLTFKTKDGHQEFSVEPSSRRRLENVINKYGYC